MSFEIVKKNGTHIREIDMSAADRAYEETVYRVTNGMLHDIPNRAANRDEINYTCDRQFVLANKAWCATVAAYLDQDFSLSSILAGETVALLSCAYVGVCEDHFSQVRDPEEVIYQLLDPIPDDLLHQFKKWGPQRLDVANWNLVVMEEFGEMLDEYIESNFDKFTKEMRQTIACIARFLVEVGREIQGLNVLEADLYRRAQ